MLQSHLKFIMIFDTAPKQTADHRQIKPFIAPQTASQGQATPVTLILIAKTSLYKWWYADMQKRRKSTVKKCYTRILDWNFPWISFVGARRKSWNWYSSTHRLRCHHPPSIVPVWWDWTFQKRIHSSILASRFSDSNSWWWRRFCFPICCSWSSSTDHSVSRQWSRSWRICLRWLLPWATSASQWLACRDLVNLCSHIMRGFSKEEISLKNKGRPWKCCFGILKMFFKIFFVKQSNINSNMHNDTNMVLQKNWYEQMSH